MNAEAPMLSSETAAFYLIAKISRRNRSLRNFGRLTRLQERKMLPVVKEWMAWMIKTLQAGLPKMRGKGAAEKAESIADWKAIEERGIEIMKPVVFETLAAGGNSVMSQRPVHKQAQRFDIIGLEAVKWATEHSAELVVEVSEKTMLAIREYIKRGVDAGKGVAEIARELRPLVGLNERQIIAVANYHEMLILDRPEYTVVQQREMAEVYARRLHRDRAALIARTETREALWEGVFEGYEQMGIDKVEGVSDPDACEWCLDNINGQVLTMEEARALDAHPGCECAWVMAA